MHGNGPGAHFGLARGQEAHQTQQRVGGRDQALQRRFLQSVARQIFARFLGLSARRAPLRSCPQIAVTAVFLRAGKRALAVFLFHFMQPRGVFFADVQHAQHRLLRQKLEAANALFVFVAEFQLRAAADRLPARP